MRAQLETALSRSSTNLHWIQRADGLQQLEIRAGFRHASMLLRNPNGSVDRRCLSDVSAAARMLDGPPP
jgi:hypothetical protein